MKQLKTLVIIAMLGAVSFTACKKDSTNPTAPDLTLTSTPNTTMVSAGQVITINVVSTASIASFKLQEDVPGQAALTTDTSSDKVGNKSLSFSYKYKIPTGVTTKTITVTITDNSGTTNTASLTFTVVSLNVCNNVVLGNQNSTDGSSFATSTCSVYTVTPAQANSAKVDFIHFFGASNGPTIAAPSDKSDLSAFPSYNINTWSVNNNTLFVRLAPSFDFTNATYSGIADAYASASATTAAINKAANMSQNDVWAFKTAAGKFGVFMVTSITGSNTSAGDVTLTVKTQN
jgi:hypothetical protein